MSQSSSPAKAVPGPEIKRFRRVVTGHDPQGQSIIASDAASPQSCRSWISRTSP